MDDGFDLITAIIISTFSKLFFFILSPIHPNIVRRTNYVVTIITAQKKRKLLLLLLLL